MRSKEGGLQNTGYKMINGFLFPEIDQHLNAVVFNQVSDVDFAIGWCKGSRLAVQAGGAVGVWADRLARHFEQVYTFEPDPNNYECLIRNCPDSRIVKFNSFLGAKEGVGGMEYPEGRENMGAGRYQPNGTISVAALDSLHLPACDLLQLDIEGTEPAALLGAWQTVEKYRPVIMVEDKGLSMHYGIPAGWSDNLLTSLGYTVVHRINRDVILVATHGQ